MAGYDDIVAQMKEDQSSIAPTPYDDVAKRIREQAEASRAQAAISVGSSINANPDRAGMNRAIAKKYNTTPEVVDHYPDEFRQRMSVELARDALKQAPKLEQSINADPSIAQVIHDDVPNNAALEAVMTEWKPSIGERLHAWINDAFNVPQREQARAMNAYAAKKAGVDGGAARDAVGGMSELMGQFGSKLYNVGSFGLIPDIEGDATTTAGSLAGGGGSLAGFVMGGPVKAADYMLGKLGIHSLENVAGQSFAKGLAKDIVKGSATLGTATALGDIGNSINSPDLFTAVKKEGSAFLSGAETGAVFGASSRLFPDNNIPSFLARAATTSLALDEINGTSPLETINKWDSLTSQEKVDRVFNYGLNTLFSAHGAGRTTGGWFHDAAKADLAVEDYNKMQTLSSLSAASKWRERDQEGFKKYVQTVTEDSNLPHVYIDGKTFAQTLNEAGITDQELARTMPDVAKQLNEAMQTDGYIKIGTADYLTHIAGGPVDAKILEHLKTDPEGKTYAEAQDFMKHQNEQLREMASKVAEDKADNEDFHRSRQAVYDDVMKQLKETGRYTPDAAKAYATLHRDFSTVMADRLKMTPEEYHQQYGAKIVSTGTGKFNQEPVIKLHGKEIHVDLNADNAFEHSKTYYKANLQGKIIHRKEIGDIRFTGKGWEKTRKGLKLNEEKAMFIPAIKSIIENGEYKGRTAVKEQRQNGTVAFHHFEAPIEINGKSFNAGVSVGEDKDGNYFYNITKDPHLLLEKRTARIKELGNRPRVIEPSNVDESTFKQSLNAQDDGVNIDISNAGVLNQSIDQTKTPDFIAWAGTDKPVIKPDEINSESFKGEGPFVMQAFHATTHEFDEFNASIHGNVEGQFGKVNYFTSSEYDAENNYAGEGPDLTQRIEQKAERLANEITDEYEAWSSDFNESKAVELLKDKYGKDNYSEDHMEMARNISRSQLHGGQEHVMEVYIRTDKPFVVGDKNNSPWLSFIDEPSVEKDAIERVADNEGISVEDVKANRDEYVDQISEARWDVISDKENPLSEAIQTVADRYEFDPSAILGSLYELTADGEVQHYRLEDELRHLLDRAYVEDPQTGDLISNQVLSDVIQELGFDSIILKDADARFKNMNMENGVTHIQVFDENNTHIKSATDNNGRFDPKNPNIFKQSNDASRGFFNPESKTIGLLKDADLSTFLHESGHFFLDTYAQTAALHPEIQKDMDVLLKWFGVDSLDQWNSMSIEEQRDSHEKFARGFEAYLMEGKAPNLELQTIFSRFRSWLLNVYKSLTNLYVELTPEVRSVMDRMLASEETIKNAEVARGFSSLFIEKPESMSDEEWQQYNDLATQATDQAISDIQSKSIRDMKWLTGARNKAIKAAQDKAAALRREVRVEVRSDVLKTPVYQAWQFLTGRDEQKAGVPPKEKVNKSLDPSRDSLFTAIAKLGGLDAAAVKSEFGFDPADMKQHVPLFGKPVFRKTEGRSVDAMAEDLAQHGYLSLDEHGKYDLHEFEERLGDELSGHEHYSYSKDYSDVNDFGQTAEDIKDLPAGRLNLSMARALDKEGAAKLEELRMTREGALDPDIVADMFGFGSGRELIQTIAMAENPKALIERLTDQRLLERHGELASPSGIERAAEAAIHNEARAKFVATGLKILTKSPISSRLILRGAKEAADGAVAAKKIRDLDAKQYSAAELKANKEALKLVAKDPAAAAMAQRSSLLNNQLVTATEKALSDVKSGIDYFKKMNKNSVRKNIDIAFRDQIDQLLSRYDLRSSLTPEQATGKSIASLESFVEHLAKMKFSIEVPEDLIINANKMHYKDMTVEQFRGLIDAVKSIEKLGREVQKITDGDQQRDINEVALEATQQLEKMPKKKVDTNRGLSRISSKWVGTKKMVRSVTASLLKTEQMVDWLDQYNPNGVFNRLVFRKIADAEGVRNDLDLKISQKWEEHVAALPSDLLKNNRGSVEMPGVIDGITGENQRLTWGEKIALAGIRGDAGHFAKLLKGEGWNTEAVLDFLDKNMTKEEWDFVKGLANTFQELYPMKEAMMRSLGASAPKEVDRIPFQTVHGEQSGWYWPITYDPARSRSVKERYAKHEASLFEDNIYTRADTSTGRENTRNDNYAKPMLLSIDVLPRILKDEIRDITTRKAIIEADRFLSHPDVRRSIINALSEEHYDLFNGWLLSIANDAMVKPSELQMWDRVAHEIRTRTTMVGLGFRVSTMLMHGMTAFGESIAEAGPKAMAKGTFNKKTLAALTTIGPEWMQKGLDSFMRDTQFAANRDFIFERSAEMRHRSNEIERDVREKLREIHVKLMDPATGAIERTKLAITSRAYQGICMLDMASALPTWMGAYLKGMESKEKGGLGMSEDDAVYFADKTVRNAHGGGGVKDIAAVQRGGEWFKLFTMFYTFWNHNINRIIDTGKRIKELPQSYQDAKATGDLAGFRGDVGTLVLRSFMYTLGVQAIHHMIHPPKEEDGEEGWLKWFAKQMALSVSGGVPLARDVAGHYAGGKDYEMSPVASMIRSTDMFVKDVEGTSKSDRFIKHALTEAGYIFGLPLGQAGSTVQFLSDVWDGKQHPQDMAEWWRGLTSGDMNH